MIAINIFFSDSESLNIRKAIIGLSNFQMHASCTFEF